MTVEEIKYSLCYYDTRNPFGIADYISDETIKEKGYKEGAKPDCFCDNCRYGKSELAEELLLLHEKTYNGWVSVNDRLPDMLKTVWVSNGKGWTSLGCRTPYYEGREDDVLSWGWSAILTGNIEEARGEITGDFEDDDWDVQFWHEVPIPPNNNNNNKK